MAMALTGPLLKIKKSIDKQQKQRFEIENNGATFLSSIVA